MLSSEDAEQQKWACRVTAHAFVDETIGGGYFVAAALLMPGDLTDARKVVKSLYLHGQRRLNFYSESESRKRKIIDVITSLAPRVTIYDGSRYRRDPDARRACLEQLVEDLAKSRAQRLVIERADSYLKSDRRILYEAVHKTGCADRLSYVHLRAHEEPLLAIPDAVAWCWTRGGRWRIPVAPLVGGLLVV